MPSLQDKIENEKRINNIYNPKPIQEPPKAVNYFKDGVAPEKFFDGESVNNVNMTDGYWKSENYVEGVSGWKIKPNGDVEFGSGKFRGDITGASGTFSGTLSGADITGGDITGTNITGGDITGTNIVTDTIKDSTYGLNGVFCKTHKSTNTSGTFLWNTGIPANGGLLNATLNYENSASGQYSLLPGFNTASVKSYYHVIKDAGVYKVRYYASNIYSDVTYTTLYFTLFFNSLETNGW